MDELQLAEEIEYAADDERRTGQGVLLITLPAMTEAETRTANEALARMGLRTRFAEPRPSPQPPSPPAP